MFIGKPTMRVWKQGRYAKDRGAPPAPKGIHNSWINWSNLPVVGKGYSDGKTIINHPSNNHHKWVVSSINHQKTGWFIIVLPTLYPFVWARPCVNSPPTSATSKGRRRWWHVDYMSAAVERDNFAVGRSIVPTSNKSTRPLHKHGSQLR